ncbi:hypothetical protein JX265_004712 [Neoarthrinium moseri]|uniref:Uncharacterized protein n=1 Tax=Neoarthrinium moseri TaxID=1658444 RepID=A0A9P9WPU7_9PEZI|nr:hypothetical protein JX265_004712 [Neoarthrinium moseri]
MFGSEGLALASLVPRTMTDFAPLNITALASVNGYSTIQCWQLPTAPVDAMSALNYGIGNTSKATWSIIEPRTVVGEAWAPSVQLSMVLNGMIHVSAPAAEELRNLSAVIDDSREAGPPPHVEAYLMPGTLASSLVIAADMKATSYISGHWIEFPSNEPTVLVQTPFADNQVPEHTVLHDGPCE